MRGASAALLIGRCHRIAEGASELGDFSLPERSVGEARMRNHEADVVHDAVAEEHDVEIQGARFPADRSRPSGRLLDTMQPG